MYFYPPLLVLALIAEARATCPAHTNEDPDPCNCVDDRNYTSQIPTFPDGLVDAHNNPTSAFFPDFDCELRHLQDGTEDHSCRQDQAFVPNGIVQQPELFLFLPGLDSDPTSTAHIPVVAAHAGHKALSISWTTRTSWQPGAPM